MKFSKNLLGMVKTIAPAVAAAIGGPFSGLATVILREAFGTDDDGEIERQLSVGDPDALVKLKLAQQAMETRMRELGIQEDQLYVKDTADARLLARATGTGPQMTLTIGFLSIYGVLLLSFFLLDFELNDWQRGQVGILIGVVTAAVGQIINFWFGTSKGSKDKALQMAIRE